MELNKVENINRVFPADYVSWKPITDCMSGNLTINTPCSVELWFYLENVNDKQVIISSESLDTFSLQVHNKQLILTLNGQTVRASLIGQGFYHLLVVFNTTVTVYINGKSVISLSSVLPNLTISYLAGFQEQTLFQGFISLFRVYENVQSIDCYNSGRPDLYSSSAKYEFDSRFLTRDKGTLNVEWGRDVKFTSNGVQLIPRIAYCCEHQGPIGKNPFLSDHRPLESSSLNYDDKGSYQVSLYQSEVPEFPRPTFAIKLSEGEFITLPNFSYQKQALTLILKSIESGKFISIGDVSLYVDGTGGIYSIHEGTPGVDETITVLDYHGTRNGWNCLLINSLGTTTEFIINGRQVHQINKSLSFSDAKIQSPCLLGSIVINNDSIPATLYQNDYFHPQFNNCQLAFDIKAIPETVSEPYSWVSSGLDTSKQIQLTGITTLMFPQIDVIGQTDMYDIFDTL